MGEKTELVPPLESFHAPRVVCMSELLAKDEVEARELDAFPLFPPYFASA